MSFVVNPWTVVNSLDTLIIVPCYNEAKRLDVEAFRRFAVAEPGVRFLFVDDGSRDETRALLNSLHEGDPLAFNVLALARNSGKAEAVRLGMLAATEGEVAQGQGRPTFTGYWDADLSTGLDEISHFRAIMLERPEIHMVFGARVNLLGRHVRRKLSRHYIGRIFATMFAWALGLAIYDTQCGAKLFRVTDEMIEQFRTPFVSKWIFDVEIIARYLRAREKTTLPLVDSIIYERPLVKWTDVAGSKLRLRHFLVVGVDVVRIYWRYLRGLRRRRRLSAE